MALPVCEKLKADKHLKYSTLQFKELLESYYNNQCKLDNIDRVLQAPKNPPPGILAKLAASSYHEIESLNLPPGWILLTTARNTGKFNGYFGIACWCPDKCQVVIAHRGTKLSSIGSLFSDLSGIILNKYVPQMYSASTFADYVNDVVEDVNKTCKVYIQMFYTGHSLGGWLAQITAFTTKYLKLDKQSDCFQTREVDGPHVHVEVFESPGCKDMLKKMKKDFQTLYSDKKNISLKSLNITTYLSAPNIINTCQTHVGTIFRLMHDLSDIPFHASHTSVYHVYVHNLKRLMEVFDSNTDHIKENEVGEFLAKRVLDWPVEKHDMSDFFKQAPVDNNFDTELFNTLDENGRCKVRYQTESYNEKICAKSVFTKNEVKFLTNYHDLQECPEMFHFEHIFEGVKDTNKIKDIGHILNLCKIEIETICVDSTIDLFTFIPLVKHLVWFYPATLEIKKTTSLINYQDQSKKYIRSLKKFAYLKDCSNCDNIRNLFWEESLKKILCFIYDEEGDTTIGLCYAFNACKYDIETRYQQSYCILDLDEFLSLAKFKRNLTDILKNGKYLLLVECKLGFKKKDEENAKRFLNNLIKIIKHNVNVKVVFFVLRDSNVHKFLLRQNSGKFIKEQEGTMFGWNDLSDTFQNELKNDVQITLQGNQEPMKLIDLINGNYPEGTHNIFDARTLSKILNDKVMNVGETLPPLGEIEHYYIERNFIKNADEENNIQDINLDDLIQQNDSKMVLISASSGMGKTAMLTRASLKIKDTFPSMWVVKVNFNDLFEDTQAISLDKESAIELLWKASNPTCTNANCFDYKVFLNTFNSPRRVTVLLDAFEEMNANVRDKAVQLIKILSDTEVYQIWLTARKPQTLYLEENLSIVSYSLKSISPENQTQFLINFWKHKMKNMNKELNNEDLKKLEENADKVLTFAKSFHSEDGSDVFATVPLHLHILAEYFEKDVLEKKDVKTNVKLNLIELYNNLVSKQLSDYANKINFNDNKDMQKQLKMWFTKMFRKSFQYLALCELFDVSKVEQIFGKEFVQIIKELITLVSTVQESIVNKNEHGKYVFIHRIFAEFFAAEWFVENDRQGLEEDLNVWHSMEGENNFRFFYDHLPRLATLCDHEDDN